MYKKKKKIIYGTKFPVVVEIKKLNTTFIIKKT